LLQNQYLAIVPAYVVKRFKQYHYKNLEQDIVDKVEDHKNHTILRTFVYGEYQYDMRINRDILIRIRSSIDLTGTAASTGEDSIRHWLIFEGGQPMSNKLTGRWTTRQRGWEKRLVDNLRVMWGLAQKAGYCECGNLRSIRKVNKGKNEGKVFAVCDNCKDKKWVELV
jgi:hypothetical protein